jgi:quercetin dioxygenase-like cupin family protein
MPRLRGVQAITVLIGVVLNMGYFAYSALAQDHSIARVFNLDDIPWGPAGGGNGFPVGVRTAQMGLDSNSGGITYYAEFPAGSKFDSHWHTHDEFVVVANGSLAIQMGEDKHVLKTGSYIVIPGSVRHEWSVPDGSEDAIILVRRAGPADFYFAPSP